MEQRTLPNFFPEMTTKTIIEPLTTTREERGKIMALFLQKSAGSVHVLTTLQEASNVSISGRLN